MVERKCFGFWGGVVCCCCECYEWCDICNCDDMIFVKLDYVWKELLSGELYGYEVDFYNFMKEWFGYFEDGCWLSDVGVVDENSWVINFLLDSVCSFCNGFGGGNVVVVEWYFWVCL